MKKRSSYVILFLASLLLSGCAVGDAWYYPYGPCYFDDDPGPQTVNTFLKQQRPE